MCSDFFLRFALLSSCQHEWPLIHSCPSSHRQPVTFLSTYAWKWQLSHPLSIVVSRILKGWLYNHIDSGSTLIVASIDSFSRFFSTHDRTYNRIRNYIKFIRRKKVTRRLLEIINDLSCLFRLVSQVV